MAFPKKFCLGQNGPFRINPEYSISSYNSGSAVMIVLQFFAMKGTRRDILLALADLLLRQIILMFFSERNLIQSNLVKNGMASS